MELIISHKTNVFSIDVHLNKWSAELFNFDRNDSRKLSTPVCFVLAKVCLRCLHLFSCHRCI